MPPSQTRSQYKSMDFRDSQRSAHLTPPTPLTFMSQNRSLDNLRKAKSSGIITALQLISPQNAAPKLRVGFSGKLEQPFCCIGREDYSPNERQSYWYTLPEMCEMEKEKNRTIQRMELGLRREKSSTYRGLEVHTSAGGIYRNKLKKKHVEAVMKVQEKQRNVDSNDWDELANISMDLSAESRRIALQFAQKDEKDVLKMQCRK